MKYKICQTGKGWDIFERPNKDAVWGWVASFYREVDAEVFLEQKQKDEGAHYERGN